MRDSVVRPQPTFTAREEREQRAIIHAANIQGHFVKMYNVTISHSVQERVVIIFWSNECIGQFLVLRLITQEEYCCNKFCLDFPIDCAHHGALKGG